MWPHTTWICLIRQKSGWSIHDWLKNLFIVVVCIKEDLLKIIYNGLWFPPTPWNVRTYDGIIFFKAKKERCRRLCDFFSLFLFQRAHLLDNTERLERSSRRLEAGYQIAVETGKNSESEQIVLLMHSSLHNTWHFRETSKE